MKTLRAYTGLIAFSSALIVFGFSGASQAISKQSFEVELIVFSQVTQSTETFDNAPSSIKWPSNMAELTETQPLNHSQPALLEEDDLKLISIVNKLYGSVDHEPLLHLGWIESVQANQTGKAIHISREVGDGLINGYVQLKRSHYLHYFVNLEYSRHETIYDSMDTPAFDENTEVLEYDSGAGTYRIDEKRRIHKNELHYFDHPRFGVIVKVTPL